MCDHWATKNVMVKIPANLSHTGQYRWANIGIDSCIADIVQALQLGGIDMRASCCCHGHPLGVIDMEDGRTLLIDHNGEWRNHRVKLLLKSALVSFIHPKKVRIKIAWRNSLWRIKNLKWKPREAI